MKISYLSSLLLLSLSLTTQAFAKPETVQVVGSIPAAVIINAVKPIANATRHFPRATGSGGLESEIKQIMLQRIVLSPSAKQYLAEKAGEPTAPVEPTSDADVDLKMGEGKNAVPVLDQGKHGSCATFSATAIIDAAAKKGDYISQLCNLELTASLYPPTPMGPHGWEGSTTFIIMNQIKRHGIISKYYQKTFGCAGVYEYPGDDANDWGRAMTSNEFARHSEPIMATINTHTILRTSHAFSKSTNMKAALTNVKKALASKHRVLIGFLVDTNFGGVGAFGHYKSEMILGILGF